MTAPDMEAARAKMIAKRFGGQSQDSRTGGKGTARRKKKTTHKTASSDDKKIGATLKKLGCTSIPEIAEVNLFTERGEVIHFGNPRVQASIGANTFVVSGPNDVKRLEQMMPGIMNQLGPENQPAIMKIQEMMSAGGMANAGGGASQRTAYEDSGSEDDAIPDLVEDFEATAAK